MGENEAGKPLDLDKRQNGEIHFSFPLVGTG